MIPMMLSDDQNPYFKALDRIVDRIERETGLSRAKSWDRVIRENIDLYNQYEQLKRKAIAQATGIPTPYMEVTNRGMSLRLVAADRVPPARRVKV